MAKPNDHRVPEYSPVPEDRLFTAFPGGFTIRDEANALTAYAFRNGPLEALHAGKPSPLLDDPTLSRITDSEIKELMINASTTLAGALALRDSDPERYRRFVQGYGLDFCRSWER
jgi:hypothetical protein